MREILFRGKRKDNGEWVEGFYSQFHNRPVVDEPNSHQIFELIDEGVKIFGTSIGGFWRIVDPETVGQYTGLADKNGTKIFEGDIVILTLQDCVEVGVIVWCDTDYRYKFVSPDGTAYGFDNTCEFEVIGNIHDNPDLLNPSLKPEYRDGDPDCPICPSCRTPLNEMEDCDCGQKIDWSEEK